MGFHRPQGFLPAGCFADVFGRISDRVILFACLGHFIPFEFGGTSCTLLAVARISSVGGDYCCFRAQFFMLFFPAVSREKKTKKLCCFNRVPLFFFFLLKPRVSYDYYYSTVPNEVFFSFFLLLLVFFGMAHQPLKTGLIGCMPVLASPARVVPLVPIRSVSGQQAENTLSFRGNTHYCAPAAVTSIMHFFCVLIGCSLQTARRSRGFLPPEKVGPPRASLELSIDPV